MRPLTGRLFSLLAGRIASPRPTLADDAPQAYLTLVGTDDYADGALVLALSLAQAGCREPLVVAAGPAVSAATIARLARAGLAVRRIDGVAAPGAAVAARNAAGGYAHWTATFDKLALFSLPGFARLVFLDSDMLVVAPLDALFDRPHLSAVAAGRSFPGREHWDRLNSGLLVIHPAAGLAGALADTLGRLAAATDTAAPNPGGMLGDQDVINAFVPDWPARPELHLPERFNVFLEHVDHYARLTGDDGGVAVVHFAGPDKPWRLGRGALLRRALWHVRLGRPLAALALLAYARLLARARAAADRAG